MENPFDHIEERLDRIEALLGEINAKPVSEIPSSDEEKFLTIDQVCDLLSVTRTTIWNWERKKILRSIMIENTKRFLRSEILQLSDATGLYRYDQR